MILLPAVLLLLAGTRVLPVISERIVIESVLSVNESSSSWRSGLVTSNVTWTVALDLGDGVNKAVRLSTSSPEANLSLPLFISVRQGRHISSWTLPYVEDGHAFSQVARTLCPSLNQPLHDTSSHLIYIDISTPASVNISFDISAQFVDNYNLKLDSPVTNAVTVSSPLVYVYEFPDNVDRVLVKVTSLSSLCALVSVQDGLCPIDQLLEYPDHRGGTYQTMQQLAAINIKHPAHQNFIHIVISVYHQSDCSDINYNFIDGHVMLNRSANYNPVYIHDDDLFQSTKNVTIEILHTLSTAEYAIGIMVLPLLLFVIFTVTLVCVIVNEIIRKRYHPAHKFLSEFKKNECENGVEEIDGKEGAEERRATPLMSISRFAACLKRSVALIRGRQWVEEFQELQNQIERGRKLRATRMVSTGSSNRVEIRDLPPLNASLTSGAEESDCNGQGQTEEKETEQGAGSPSFMLQRHPSYERALHEGGIVHIEASCEAEKLKTFSENFSHEIEVIEPDPVTEVTETHFQTIDQSQTHTTAENGNGSHCITVVDTPSASSSSSTPAHDPHSCNELRYLNQLPFPEGKEFQRNYKGYWMYLTVLVVFYSLPTYQLLLTYQQFIQYSGNGDFCYYNTLCSHPLLGIKAFNNILSNIVFFGLGILFIIIASRRRSVYRLYEEFNEFCEANKNPEKKVGVPEYFGLYYAAGIALMGEAIMSAAYHICPTGNNYQFDTTMMFVLVTLGLYQLFQCRNPDITPSPNKLLLVLALLILFIAMGVIYSGLAFYIVFFTVYEICVLYTSLQIYYRWTFRPVLSFKAIFHKLLTPSEYSLTDLIKGFFEKFWNHMRHPCPPKNIARFIYLVWTNSTNLIGAIVLVAWHPPDFATAFLGVLIVNFMSSLIYVLIVKCVHCEGGCWKTFKMCVHCDGGCWKTFKKRWKTFKKRWKSFVKPIAFLVLSLCFWIGGIICYTRAVTNWLESPAVSRNGNQECILFGFYDTHDLWHILSAFGIFFSFLLLMTLEDNVEFKERSKLRIY